MNRLKLIDDWGYFHYEFDGKRLPVKKGIAVVVFPDGFKKEIKFVPKEVTKHVNDMGHELTASSHKFIAHVHHHSQIFEIELSKLNVIEIKQ